MKPRHGQAALVIGRERPAMSVSWEPPKRRKTAFFLIFMADLYPGDEGFEDLPQESVCLHCLMEDGDEQLGRGLDMARRFGRADYDEVADEWFVPEDEA